MIIILNNPEIAELIRNLFSTLNPDTPFDASALTEQQRKAISVFIKRGFLSDKSLDEEEHAIYYDSPFAVCVDMDEYGEAEYDLVLCSVEQSTEHLISIAGIDFLHNLKHVEVSPGATSLWLHF